VSANILQIIGNILLIVFYGALLMVAAKLISGKRKEVDSNPMYCMSLLVNTQ
jgi:hypothetical protein